MSPTILTEKGKPFLALGSPGGSTIITTVLQVIFNRLDRGLSLPRSVREPRATQRNATSVTAEQAFIDRYGDRARAVRPHLRGAGGPGDQRGRDRRGDRHRVPLAGPPGRGVGAHPARRGIRPRRPPRVAVELSMASTYTVERSRTIDVTPDRLFALITDFQQWTRWSPWEDVDPDLHRAYAGAESGAGATYAWAGNRKAGEGTMEILRAEQRPGGRRRPGLREAVQARAPVVFLLTPVGESTHGHVADGRQTAAA